MYLARLEVENFRVFGTNNRALSLDLDPGLNLIVGENDGGKSALVDAVRLLLGTASNEWFRLAPSDFHIVGGIQATTLRISALFLGMNKEELAGLANYLTMKSTDGVVQHSLLITLSASRHEPNAPGITRGREVSTTIRAGEGDHQLPFDGYAREFLRAIYLKPLRDAVQELAARQGSRLSQILYAHPDLRRHEESDWSSENPDARPETLLGIAQQADYRIKASEAVKQTQATLNSRYLEEFSLSDTRLRGAIGLRSSVLRQLLERMELYLEHDEALVPGANRGLGINNLLFMSTELLLLGAMQEPYLPLLLIEEPEAHLHPQLQLLLIEYLTARSKRRSDDPADRVQVILTSHSPNLASKVELQRLIVMRDGTAFRMGPEFTRLEPSDYKFLHRFLDVTRAALFFARGLLIVEGDAEALLLPTLASLIGLPLSKSGVTTVNVGHVGLFRYMRIFQRRGGPDMPVRVSCIVDLDIPPAEARPYLQNDRKTLPDFSKSEIAVRLQRKMRHDGGPVRTFVSPLWTLEYDLALSGLAAYVSAAIALAKSSDEQGRGHESETARELLLAHEAHYAERVHSGATSHQIAADIYRDLYTGNASKAETAQYLALLLELHPPQNPRDVFPRYLIDAVEYATGVVRHVLPENA